MIYLGDFAADATVDFMWATYAADGSSITRATNGTVSVYRANDTSQTTTGVTDTEDFDSLTGIHHCRIVTTDGFYATGSTYMVVLSGAVIDGKNVNKVLAHFSIENRPSNTPPSANTIADAVWNEARSGHTTAGSFGEGVVVNSIADDAITSDALASGALDTDAFASGAITSGVIAVGALHWQSFGTGAITAAAIDPGAFTAEKFATDTINKIADGVWDEGLGAHMLGDSTGEALFNAASSTAPTANQNATAVWANATRTLTSSAAPTAAAIADAVWDEATADHTTAGSTGKALTDANNGTPPTAAAIADAVWDESLGSHLTADSTGEALFAASSSTDDPWNVALPGSYTSGKAGWILGTRLDAQVSSVAPGGEAGAGGSQFTYTLTEAGTGTPIADADIWASTDSAGTTIVASGRTNQQGQVIFWLDPGTVYIWRQKTGWNFTNPDVETVA